MGGVYLALVLLLAAYVGLMEWLGRSMKIRRELISLMQLLGFATVAAIVITR